MNKKMLLVIASVFLALHSINVQASEKVSDDEIKVEIVSPETIESTPIYEGNIEVAVTNMSDTERSNLNCYLSVVDEDRKQSFPMDEFGEDSYQTRTISSLKAGETVTLSIPVRVMYVGNFQLVANVIDYATNQVYVADSLKMTMISNSNLHKNLVIIVSVIVPVMLAGVSYILNRKRGKRKE